jgi:hypothetical protein
MFRTIHCVALTIRIQEKLLLLHASNYHRGTVDCREPAVTHHDLGSGLMAANFFVQVSNRKQVVIVNCKSPFNRDLFTEALVCEFLKKKRKRPC